jgi:hypothetical protein
MSLHEHYEFVAIVELIAQTNAALKKEKRMLNKYKRDSFFDELRNLIEQIIFTINASPSFVLEKSFSAFLLLSPLTNDIFLSVNLF